MRTVKLVALNVACIGLAIAALVGLRKLTAPTTSTDKRNDPSKGTLQRAPTEHTGIEEDRKPSAIKSVPRSAVNPGDAVKITPSAPRVDVVKPPEKVTPSAEKKRLSVPELVENLRKAVEAQKDDEVQLIVEQLKGMGLDAVPAMVALLQTSSSPVMRRMAVAVMDDLMSRQFGEFSDGWYSNRKEMLAKVHDPANASLIYNFRTQMLPALIYALENDPDVLTRRWAASAVGQLGGLSAAQALEQAIRRDKQEWGIKEWAVQGLSNIWDLDALSYLTQLGRDETFPQEGRQAALRSIGLIDSPYALSTLESFLNDAKLKGWATAVIGSVDTPAAKQVMERINAVQEPPKKLVLVDSVPYQPPPNTSSTTVDRAEVERITREIGDQLSNRSEAEKVSILGAYLTPSSPSLTKQIALQNLRSFVKNADAITTAERVIRYDSDTPTRMNALHTLGNIGTGDTVKLLDQLEKDWTNFSKDRVPATAFDQAREEIYKRTVHKE